MEDRITELEIRLTHFEDTIDVLNQAIIRQHNEIDQLQLQISALEKKLKASQATLIAHESEETPPPHY
jgi:SlyX protein